MARSTRRRPSSADTEHEVQDSEQTNEVTDTDEAPAQPEGQSEETEVTVTENAEQTEDVQAEPAQDQAASDQASTDQGASGQAEPEKVDPVAAVMALGAEVVESRDVQTATIPVADVARWAEAYRALEGAQKTATRREITAKITELIDGGDEDEDQLKYMYAARAWNELLSETKKAAPARAAAPKVDPTDLYVESYMAIQLAGQALPIPDGVNMEKASESFQRLTAAYQDPESDERKAFDAYLAWSRAEDKENRGDEPEVADYVKRAMKIAEGRAVGARGASRRTGATRSGGGGGGRVGGGRDIAKHVIEAMASHPVGEFVSIASICKFVSEEYGEAKPSAGAVSARLFPQSGGPSTIEGVEGVSAEDSPEGKKGARRTQ